MHNIMASARNDELPNVGVRASTTTGAGTNYAHSDVLRINQYSSVPLSSARAPGTVYSASDVLANPIGTNYTEMAIPGVAGSINCE
jgi:hypothetical protein